MRLRLLLALCFFGSLLGKAQSTDKILSAEVISKLLPDKLKGFYLSEDSKSKVIKLGTIQYSIAERKFYSNKDRSIKILLFDYKEAPIMYNQATKKFSNFTPVDSDSLILRSVVMNDCTGWESHNIQKNSSQILLGICNRYFLTIEGTNVDLDFLKKCVQSFNVEKYPK